MSNGLHASAHPVKLPEAIYLYVNFYRSLVVNTHSLLIIIINFYWSVFVDVFICSLLLHLYYMCFYVFIVAVICDLA